MEPESSLRHSQVPTTCPYPEPALPSPTPHPTSFHLRLGLMDLNNIENRQKTNLRVKRFLCHDIKDSLQETGYAGLDWINVTRDMSARDTILNTFEH